MPARKKPTLRGAKGGASSKKFNTGFNPTKKSPNPGPSNRGASRQAVGKRGRKK